MKQAKQNYILVSRDGNGTNLSLKGVTIALPNDERTLVENFNLTLQKGDRLMLTGPSGSGKSILAKAILSIWDCGEGRVTLPVNTKIMMVSQKVYFPNTSVRGILNSPDKEGHFNDAELSQALVDVKHDRLIQHIPGQQEQIMMDDLLNELPGILAPFENKELSDENVAVIRTKILKRTEELVHEQFNFVQYVPEAQKEYLRKKLPEVMKASLSHPPSESQVQALANDITTAIDEILTQPVYDALLDRMVSNAERHAPKSSSKLGYFSWNMRRGIKKALNLYMENEDTDDKARVIKINKDQATYITTTISNTIEQRLRDEHCTGGTLRSIFNFATWPLSLIFTPLSAKKTAKDIVQDFKLFMHTQHVTGDTLSRQLSGGEQQRLMFARILLHKPDVLILDEITAALDMPSGDALYKDMVEKLPDTIMISIAHNTHIMKHHTHHGELDPDKKKITVRKIGSDATGESGDKPKNLCPDCPYKPKM